MNIPEKNLKCTVKLGNKERFDKEQIGIKESFPVTNLPFTYSIVKDSNVDLTVGN